jgi:putative hydrolase of the HAD superfamily
VQHIKPEASIYQLLQSRYQLAPAQTLFIDDMPVNVQAARACGWTGIHFESAAQLATELRLHGF